MLPTHTTPETAQSMREIIERSADLWGEKPAFRYKQDGGVQEKTYADLKRDSEAFSRALESAGMRGKHVAIVGPTSYEWVVAYFGTVNSGGVAVPLDALLPPDEVGVLAKRAQAEMLVYDQSCAGAAQALAGSGVRLVCIQDCPEESGADAFHTLLAQNKGTFSCELDVDRMCAILFTSGTTGKSKGVMLTHRGLAVNATCLDMGFAPGIVTMTLLPIHHAYCFTMDVLKALSIGACICINDSILRVSQNMKLFQPELILAVPMMIETIRGKLAASKAPLPKKMIAKAAFGAKLATICSGGAYLDPGNIAFFAEYGITILQGYGLTEHSPVISTNLKNAARTDSVGKLLPGTQVKIVEEEIWVKGPCVMLGYYEMPEETAQALAPDGWLRTGDLGRVDADGYLYITGRLKNLIILSNGENISPEELENELCKSPLVKEVIVAEEGALIGAEIFPDFEFAAKKKIRDLSAALWEVVERYNEKIPPYKRIRSLRVRDEEFPKTPSRKIRRT